MVEDLEYAPGEDDDSAWQGKGGGLAKTKTQNRHEACVDTLAVDAIEEAKVSLSKRVGEFAGVDLDHLVSEENEGKEAHIDPDKGVARVVDSLRVLHPQSARGRHKDAYTHIKHRKKDLRRRLIFGLWARVRNGSRRTGLLGFLKSRSTHKVPPRRRWRRGRWSIHWLSQPVCDES